MIAEGRMEECADEEGKEIQQRRKSTHIEGL